MKMRGGVLGFIGTLVSRGLERLLRKLVGLGSDSRNSSGASTSEVLKLEIVLKTVCAESSEYVRS